MMVFNVYEHDTNEVLKCAQHDCYDGKVSHMFEQTKRRFIQADVILQTNLPIIKEIRAIERIDHRVLQDAHDIIAAAYRYDCDDGGQLNLFRQDKNSREDHIRKWTQWYEDKITELLENPAFVRFVVLAVLHTNTKTGYEFEHRLCGFLTDYLGMQNWNSTVGYVKRYAELKS